MSFKCLINEQKQKCEPQIHFSLKVDEDGDLNLHARDVNTGISAKILYIECENGIIWRDRNRTVYKQLGFKVNSAGRVQTELKENDV